MTLEDEPYYRVLSEPQFLCSRIEESRASFFESGEREVERLIHWIRASGRGAVLNDVVEFGCGPGRLLPALARRGFRVTAVDRSSAMLALARENAERLGASAIEFVPLQTFVQQERRFDLIILSRVLQQSGVAEGLAHLRLLTQRLHPGGFLYLNVPFQSSRSALSRSALAMRKVLPPLNRIANRLRHRPAHVPVIVPTVYPLDHVIVALQSDAAEILEFHVEREGELMTVHLLARKAGSVTSSESFEEVAITSAVQVPVADEHIVPSELIRSLGIEELHARAERYFAQGADWTPQLAKPFSSPGEAPAMLISLGVVLQGLSLVPGMTVVDFGGGTGWLSRFLLQFGCRVILCDVAPSALNIARSFIERYPPVGGSVDRLSYSLFDGHRLAIGDEEVDRIVCFDSFHHVPNAEAVLREFGRILKPGGIAAFSEPGPEHSRSAQSQFEMRVYGVLENDVDVHAIWQIARTATFEDLKLFAFNGAPGSMTLQEFDDFLVGGRQLQIAARNLRDFTANVRTFTLRKRGVEKLDSRVARGLSSEIEVDLAGSSFTAHIVNAGIAEWLPSDVSPGGVSLGAHLYRDGVLVDFEFLRIPISTIPVMPNERMTVHGLIPPLEPGAYTLEFDCVADRVSWFMQAGSKTTRVPLSIL